MRISDDGLRLIESFEGCKLKAYQDSVGVWTIGIGHTGGEVYEGQEITRDQAYSLLRNDVLTAENCVNACVKVPITQSQFDALVSLVFNIGCGNFRKSTLLKKLADGDDVGASEEFVRWNKAGVVVLAGLTRRRKAEAALFLS